MLGPEQREHRELEVIRLPSEQTPDPLELAVREPQRAVQTLFRDLRQGVSVPRRPAGTLAALSRSYAVLIGALAAIWGASYLFIKVAVRDFPPAAMMEVRLAVSGLLLALFLFVRSGFRPGLGELAATGWAGFALGIVNGAIPFTLIAWGEQHIDSGIAAVANATVPIFNAALVPWLLPAERLSRRRLVGVLVGLSGVAVLALGQPEVSWWFVAGTAAVVVASLAYGLGGILAQRSLVDTRGPALAAASMLGGAVVLLPLALLNLPEHAPGWKSVASLAALTVAGTAFAQLILFRAIRLHGSARTALVTYLMPPIALVYGAAFLGEAITIGSLGGLLLILLGVALGSGALRFAGRRPAVQEP
jgi:drug/metabolite transporter (DMT)-like permease